jgi:hypothetical protein
LTDRRRLLLSDEQVVREINLFLRGFAAYFRYGNSATQLAQINRYAAERLALFVAALALSAQIERMRKRRGLSLTGPITTASGDHEIMPGVTEEAG